MATLILNETAVLLNAIHARVEYLVRQSMCLDDVHVTPIADIWPGTGDLPYFGYQYMTSLTIGLSAQVWATSQSHFRVLLGSQRQLCFPSTPGLDVNHCQMFADKMQAADLIVNWLEGNGLKDYAKQIF